MKYLAICIGFGLAIQVVTANAADSSHSVEISAKVPKVCSFSAPVATNTTADGFKDISPTASKFVVNINQATLTPNHTAGVIRFPASFCNYNAYIKLNRHGLVSATDPTGNFKNKIYYKATAGWVGKPPLILDIDDIDTMTDLIAPISGDFEITIDVPVSTDKLVDGDYQDTLTLTISENM